MSSIPDVQRAWVVVRRGKPADAIILKNDWPVSKNLEQGEVLVRVEAAALNPMSVKFSVITIAIKLIHFINFQSLEINETPQLYGKETPDH